MILNIAMLVQNRPRLTEQAIRSLYENTSHPARVIVVDDGSSVETQMLLRELRIGRSFELILHDKAIGTGDSRNEGFERAIRSDARWGEGLLYTTDNDSYHLPGWDRALVDAYEAIKGDSFKVLGGYCHPYQQTTQLWHPMQRSDGRWTASVEEKLCIGTFSWLMGWDTWDKYGPFVSTPGANGSDDVEFCRRVRADGGRVGCINPAVVINCGATGSNGRPCPGSEFIWSQQIPEGVVVE